MKRELFLLEQLTPDEQRQACADVGRSLGALEHVFLYRSLGRWRETEQVFPSSIRAGYEFSRKERSGHVQPDAPVVARAEGQSPTVTSTPSGSPAAGANADLLPAAGASVEAG